MTPDPAQPILDLTSTLPVDLLDLAHAVAPACFALLLAGLVAGVAVTLIRRAL